MYQFLYFASQKGRHHYPLISLGFNKWWN